MTSGQKERTASAPSPASGPPNARRWTIFAVVSVALFMASIDMTIVATALPTLQSQLHAPVNWSAWTITVYSLGQVIAMPLAGSISDLYGRKRVFLVCAAIFTAASLACGLANDIYVLVALRAVQALGGGAFMPSATGLVSDAFGPDRDRAVGLFASIFPIGGVVGPVVGGLLTTYWSWRGIFLVNVPLGIGLIVIGLAVLPGTDVRRSARLDLLGVGLLAGTLLGAMFAITDVGAGVGFGEPQFVAPAALAVVLAILFVRHSARSADPLVPIRLLRGRAFAVMNLFNVLFGAAALGFGTLVPLYAEQRYGVSTLSAGTLLTARAVGMIMIAALATYALRRTGYRLPMMVGSGIVACGLLLMAIHPLFGTPYVWLTVGAGITGLGMGLSIPATNNAVLNMAPERTAAITGLRGMFRQGGAITGISVSTAILAQAAHPGVAMARIFAVFAAIIALTVPLARLVPDHRGSW